MLTKCELYLRVHLCIQLVLVAITVLHLVECNEAEITEVVTRSSSRDGYGPLGTNGVTTSSCSDNNEWNYLVSEGLCVSNEELLNGCSFHIAANQDNILSPRLWLKITNGSIINQMYDIVLMRASTSDSSNTQTDAVIVHNGTKRTVSSAHCYISHLEVYRGRRQVFVISHGGLSLNERGNIEINSSKLSYNYEEYLGELFRMNLSCSDGGLPESGCLFFKVIGTANVTDTKFNDIVPGTIYGEKLAANTSHDHSMTSTETHPINSSPNTSPMTPQISDSNNDFFIYILISGTLVAALIFVVVLLCIILVYCCSTTKKQTEKRSAEINPEDLWCGQHELIAIRNERQHEYPQETITVTVTQQPAE